MVFELRGSRNAGSKVKTVEFDNTLSGDGCDTTPIAPGGNVVAIGMHQHSKAKRNSNLAERMMSKLRRLRGLCSTVYSKSIVDAFSGRFLNSRQMRCVKARLRDPTRADRNAVTNAVEMVET